MTVFHLLSRSARTRCARTGRGISKGPPYRPRLSVKLPSEPGLGTLPPCGGEPGREPGREAVGVVGSWWNLYGGGGCVPDARLGEAGDRNVFSLVMAGLPAEREGRRLEECLDLPDQRLTAAITDGAWHRRATARAGQQ